LILDDAERQELAANLPEDGQLPYPVRREIRLALAESGQDRVRRLGELCARRVVPLWTAAFPDDDLPIAVMEQALAGGDDVEAALGRVRTHLDDVYDPEPPYRAAFAAGMACWAVANESFTGETYEPEADEEREFDPDFWPPCFFASAAAANGATWEEGSDNAARADFWRWYLLEAVPTARDGR